MGYFQRKKKKKEIWLPLSDRGKKGAHRRQLGGPSSQTDTEGHFNPLLKKGGATPKKQSPTNSYTPFSTLTLIVPSILRNFQRTPTISQTWHAPELIPAPGMWRRERDTFTGLSFFVPLNLGSEVTTVEKVEGSCVSPKPCLQKKQDTVPER